MTDAGNNDDELIFGNIEAINREVEADLVEMCGEEIKSFNAEQKQKIITFMDFVEAEINSSIKYLREANWNIEVAMNKYLQENPDNWLDDDENGENKHDDKISGDNNNEFEMIHERLKNLEKENEILIKTHDENLEIELKNITQSMSEIMNKNNELTKEIKEIKKRLANIGNNDNNNDEKKEEEMDELKVFLSDKKYKVNLMCYYDLFKDEGFEEMDVLKELNDNDLVSMKINKKAHRIKILRGIKILNNDNNNNNNNNNNDERIAVSAYNNNVVYADDMIEGANVINTKF